MSENKLEQELHQTLSNFLESGGHDLLKWFIEIEKKHNKKFLASKIIFEKFWDNFVKNGPHDIEIFKYLLTNEQVRTQDSLIERLISLIETGEENQFSTLIGIMADRGFKMDSEIRSKLRDTCKTKTESMEYPKNITLYNAIINSLSSSEQGELKMIAEKIQVWTTDGIPEKQSQAFKLLKLINEKANLFTDPIGADFCLETVEDYLSKNDVQGFIFIDFLIEYKQKLTYRQNDKIQDILERYLSKDMPKNIQLEILKRIEKLINLKDFTFLKIVLNCAESTSDNDLKTLCKNILVSKKDKIMWNQEDKAKRIFGKDFFNKQD